MNKRYIDFVPADQKKSVERRSVLEESLGRGVSAGRKVGTRRGASARLGVASQRKANALQGVGRRRSVARVATLYREVPQDRENIPRKRVQPRTEAKIKVPARAQAGRPSSPMSTNRPNVSDSSRAVVASRSTVIESLESFEPLESRTMQYVASGLSIDDGPALGVIENLNERFVSTDVDKRPLSDGKPLPEKNLAKEAKSKKLIGRRNRGGSTKQPVEKPVEKSAEKDTKKTYNVPKSPFINQEKVVKRPLSRNVYTKKAEPSKEEHGPVTIIAKPEKDSRIGIVVAIVLIIILGAAAGTVAFLLLPK